MNDKELMQEEEFIDIKAIILRYVKYFRRRWFLLLLLAVLGTAAGLGYAQTGQYSEYTASATYYLEKSGSVVTNASLTSRLAEGISTITKTSDFHEQMNEALGTEASDYKISAYATDDANIMTLYVRSDDADLSNNILENFDQVYISWATNLIGSCTLTKGDEELCSGPSVYGQSRKKLMILGFAAGVFIWFLLATLNLLTKHTILDTTQMNQVTMSTCMGLIPEIRKKKRDKSTRDPLLMSTRNINHDYLQSMRQVRHQLEKRMSGKKVLLLTSTHSGEGKSLITLNLAYDLKNRGKKIIVIDTDFDHHGIAGLLQVQENGENGEDRKTLMDYLTDQETVPEDLVSDLSDYDGIRVLFSSWDSVTNPDYLNMERFGQIISYLKESADYILIDTPSVGIRGDAILFAEAADAVWYIVRYDFADVSDIRTGMAPFYRNGKLDGYVINRAQDMESTTRYGRYGYGYGYGKGGYGYSKGDYGYGYGSKKKGSKKGDEVLTDDDMLDW